MKPPKMRKEYPYAPIPGVAAAFVITMGISVLRGSGYISFPIPFSPPERRGLLGLFIFGLTYGMASIGCSAPVFFSVLLYAVSTGGLVNAFFTFLAYSGSMALPLILVSILAARARSATLKRIRSIIPMLQKISGVFLVLIRIYLISLFYSVYIKIVLLFNNPRLEG